MMGTDQRDLFVPSLRTAIETYVPPGGHIFDFRCGRRTDVRAGRRCGSPRDDGVARRAQSTLRRGLRHFLERQPHLQPGVALAVGLDDLVAGRETGHRFCRMPSISRWGCLCCISRRTCWAAPRVILRLVKPGGVFFAVVTDESASFTGCGTPGFRESGGLDPIPMADFCWTSTNGDGT